MTDQQLQREVERVLEVEGALDRRDISVSVQERIVTLRGSVCWHLEKSMAEEVARSVPGIGGIVNDLVVR